MKKKTYIVVFIILIGLILSIAGVWKFNNVNAWTRIRSDLKKDNPDWRPNTIENRNSIVVKKDHGLSGVLSGPNLRDLSSLEPYNFWAVGLLDIGIDNLKFLKNSNKLERLAIMEAPDLKDISMLYNTKVKVIVFNRVAVDDITIIASLPLESFTLTDSKITNILPLGKIKTLKWVDFSGCKKLKNISALAKLPALKNVVLNNSGVEDLTPLKGMTLDYLSIIGTPAAKKPLPNDLKVKKLFK